MTSAHQISDYNPQMAECNAIASQVIGSCIAVHKIIGSGMRRKTYIECLVHELNERNIQVKTNIQIPLVYKNNIIDEGIKIDMLIDESIILLPVVSKNITEEHVLELLNLLKHANCPLGLIVNFNERFLRGGAIRRVIRTSEMGIV